MLKQLRLVNFRSFEDFTVTFGSGSYLVGPNNAGKSTLLTAIRLADSLIRYSHRRKADRTTLDREVRQLAYPVSLRDFPSLRDSLRHEFGDAETRLELQWKNGSRLTAVWPEESEYEGEGFFYLSDGDGLAVKAPSSARKVFPQLGTVPILGPADTVEKLLDQDYVRLNVPGRLSSRHFRNQLRILKETGELDGFWTWAEPWLGDLVFDGLDQFMGEDGPVLRAFFYEGSSRVPKELVWAGDGIQVWLQILYHVFRVRDHDTIVLDEPEVYLHPDLQRRLVRLLESTGRQTVIATHSSEMVAESDGRLTTVIDKTRKRAVRPTSDRDFEMLTSALGTAFNLRLARALRSKAAVFVEGQDMTILRRFAKTLGLSALETETGVTVLPLNGYTNWGHVEPFKWLVEELFPDALATFVILDRDYRSESNRSSVIDELASLGIRGHVWKRKELESYLLTPSVFARLSGAPEATIQKWLHKITKAMENEVFGRLLDETMKEERTATRHAVTVTTTFKPWFDAQWKDPAFRLDTCPPKQVIARMNDRLQAEGYGALSMTALARAHRAPEILPEIATVLGAIEEAIR